MKDKKVIFMGTPDFAVPILEMLIENTKVVLVVTQPDKEVGRKKEIKYTPVKELAIKNNIEVFQPTKIKESYEYILTKKPDIIITCAYGQIIPNELIETPQYKAINVHASLLPKLRGGAPIHHAIIDGYEKTGITIMYMSSKMDAGDIISQKEIKIEEKDNVGVLHDKLSKIGTELLKETLPTIFENKNERIIQDENKVTFGYNITREEEKIDFNNNLTDEEIISFFDNYPLAKKYLNNNVKNSIHIKVYSNFLKDTAESMGFTIDDENYDYVVYPDYLADEVQNETQTLIEISSHNFVSKNPFVRLEKRYEILEKLI